jgi:hypothetical protein
MQEEAVAADRRVGNAHAMNNYQRPKQEAEGIKQTT